MRTMSTMTDGNAWAPDPWPGEAGTTSSDAVAREAAQLVLSGRVESVRDGILVAMDLLGAEGRDRPGTAMVRRHIQAMTMQEIGEAAYRARVRRVLDVAEQAMTAIDLAFDDVSCDVTGRAAQGYIDGGVTVTIRLHTDRALEDIAAHLEELGYEELKVVTASTRYGRMSQLQAMDDDQPIVFTRIPLEMKINRSENLFREKPIVTRNLEQIRAQLNSME